MSRQLRVLAGPHTVARRYAAARGWSEEQYIIVTRAHQLAKLDPALVASIHMVRVNGLGTRIAQEIRDEVGAIKALWPVPTMAAA